MALYPAHVSKGFKHFFGGAELLGFCSGIKMMLAQERIAVDFHKWIN